MREADKEMRGKGYLHRKGKAELIGNPSEGYIVVPNKRDWRTTKL